MNNKTKTYFVLSNSKGEKYKFDTNSLNKCYITPKRKQIDKGVYNINLTDTINNKKIDSNEIITTIIKFGELVYKSLDSISIESNNFDLLFKDTDIIISNTDIQKEFISILNKYGYSIEWIIDENDYDTYSKLPEKTTDEKDLKDTFLGSSNSINTIYLINISLITYIMYLVKDIIKNEKRRNAYTFVLKNNLLKSDSKGQKVQFKNYKLNDDEKKKITKLLYDYINYSNHYINKYFKAKNFYKMQLGTVEHKEYLPYIDSFSVVYFINDYFLYVYESIMKTLHLKHDIQFVYFCDNCGTIIEDNYCLCNSCTKKYGNELLRKTKDEKTKETIKKELEQLDNTCYPLDNSTIIISKYKSKIRNQKYDNKPEIKKRKKEQYKKKTDKK